MFMERRERIQNAVLASCLPAGPAKVGGKPMRLAASEQREQSVADMGRLQEIDTWINELFEEVAS